MKAVIFDMDGLMINSEVVTFESYQEILKSMNLSMSREFYLSLLGKPDHEITQQMADEYGNDFPFYEVLKQVHQLMHDRFANDGVPLKKGLIALLQDLKAHHIKTIVATSSNRDRVDEILTQAHLTEYFDDSICGDEVTHGKPDPEIFIKACEKLHILPSEAVVLEDSEAGIQSSYNAHIPVICVPDMKYPQDTYVTMTYKICRDLLEVKDLLHSAYK